MFVNKCAPRKIMRKFPHVMGSLCQQIRVSNILRSAEIFLILRVSRHFRLAKHCTSSVSEVPRISASFTDITDRNPDGQQSEA